jgi:hypothetical protein
MRRLVSVARFGKTEWSMNTERLNHAIKVDMTVQTSDGSELGRIAEVWPDVGVGESWGAAGSMPQTGAEATDMSEYAFSEAMPGEGDSYFRVREPDGSDLYVPFAAVSGIDGQVLTVAVDEATVPSMQWDVMPDFVNITNEPDSHGGSHVA